MAGGNFDINVGKIRPGVYVNVKSKKTQKPSNSSRGIAVVPLVGYNWGPSGEFIKLSCEAPDSAITKLGHSVYDDNDFMLLIREILKRATTCYVYPINSGVKAAATVSGLTITAAYAGTRGNDITVVSVANTAGGFDVSVYLGTEVVETVEGVKTIADLIAAASGSYVVFSGATTGTELTAFASTSLTGGTDGTSDNAAVTAFLDKLETIHFNTLCFPITETTLQNACVTKMKTLRTKAGRYVQAVIPDATVDSEGDINVTNSVVVDGKSLTHAQACAWVAGATAGASKTESLTYVEYDGATAVVDPKTNEEAELAIKNGEFFFSMSESDKVVVEYDINSLHTFTTTKTSDYRKNRVLRVYDSFCEDLQSTFPPNKFPNDTKGWAIMEGLGKALLQQYENDGAITDVDLDSDFFVDTDKSSGDETYFNVGLKAVDSAEKLYFSVSTR